MATIIARARRPSLTGIYLVVLIAALVIVAVGATIWLSTDNSGTNALATDEKATTRVP
jgi:flagellar basal body-associated protein FliL